MRYHPEARLTVHQRRAMRDDFLQGASLLELAAKYHVSKKTVQKWVHREDPTDRSSAPHHRRSKRPPGYKAAVLHVQRAHADRGTRRLTHELHRYFPTARRGTVRHILRVAQRLEAARRRPRQPRRRLRVGWHRLQMDIQQLPALGGGTGHEYKVALIHLRTRMKYSEILPDHRTATVAAMLRRALDRLPPAWLVQTDNALEFTMRFSANPKARNAFQRTAAALGLIHTTTRSRMPTDNAFIERSHRTANAECFHARYFASTEERRYYHRLYEMDYNSQRPHQGLGGATPLEVYCRDYPGHATAHMLLGATPNWAMRGTT